MQIKRAYRSFFVLFCTPALLACGDGGGTPIGPIGVRLAEAFPNLRFTRPVFLTHSGDNTNRLFVVEQAGTIRVFPNQPQASQAEVFLDIRDRVNDGANEMGLLGLAFHPDFSNNGFFYVDYTTGSGGQRRTVISRFSLVPGQPDRGDPNSELVLLEVHQPFSNHNGGMLQFGPDGFLYISLGDGGSAGDPQNNGQNRSTLLGAILRIDVDTPSGGRNYGIPSDNPFAGNTEGFREEIFAYGLRNPWRFSIDFPSGEIWAGDVGQNTREEVDLIEPGKNYGWRIMEGTRCFNPSQGCNQSGLTLPVLDYGRDQGFSVTGGYVYRGSRVPQLDGAYIYGDFGSGRIWMLKRQSGENTLLVDSDLGISSFGVDEQNELFVLDLFSGGIFRFEENQG